MAFRVSTLALVATIMMVAALPIVCADSAKPFVAGYILMSAARNGQKIGLQELAALADKADSLPVNRIVIGFFDPTMVYKKGSQTLEQVGLNVSSTGDFGYADLKKSIDKMRQGGLEVYLSMGGWNYNCWPYMYMRYSVGGYGVNTPNYYKIQEYGGGDMDNCNDDNQYCFVCEPPSEGTTLNDFSIFPEVPHSSVWQQAVKFVESNAKGNQTPQWNNDIIPGRSYTDSKTNITMTVPGKDTFMLLQSDPYQDLVQLAYELGADGVDLDYEEFWHADYFKFGAEQGPWWLPQTVYKYTAIAQTIILHIKNISPKMGLSTAASAVGAWSTNWWGGNLKGVWYYANQWYPSVINFMSKGPNAGGINVMTYDLSDNPQFHECPQEGQSCTLSAQVEFYMQTYDNASINANVGYEIGTPAYPSPDHDPTHQLPLTQSELSTIISKVQPKRSGFFWELFKPINDSTQATPTQVAQTACKVVLNNDRCKGSIPVVNATIAV